jgi:hypothetical protein
LSYHRAGEIRADSGSPTVTVCTNDVAGGDLVEHGLPVAVGKACGDAEVLVPEVVELEDERVAFAAVHAGPLAEELDEIGRAPRDQRPFSPDGIRHVALAMQRVVLPFVGSSTGAAVVVPLAPCAAAPGAVRDGQEPAASPTGSPQVRWTVRHERMFAERADVRGG